MEILTKKAKVEALKSKLRQLSEFKSNLNSDTINKFEIFKSEVLPLLEDSQKAKFSQIVFYERDYYESNDYDLPF